MIIKNDEHKIDNYEKFAGGEGKVAFKRLIQTPDELYDKGRVFSVATLEKNGSLGVHAHKDEEEFYYILSGTGEYYDNGVTAVVTAGDTTVCKAGESHGIKNIGDDDLVYVALILFK